MTAAGQCGFTKSISGSQSYGLSISIAGEFADFYGESAVSADGYWIEHIHPDVIIPIPLNRKKLRTRGFNQAELLAKVIGRRMNIPVDTKVLIRSHWTEPQKNLSPVQRFANLKKAFQVHLNPRKQYKTVLLIDDIYTTGSTMDACAKLLKEHGIFKSLFCCALVLAVMHIKNCRLTLDASWCL